MEIKVQVLASTSSGNSTLIWADNKAVLVDCGIGIRRIRRCLLDCGLSLSDISSVIITHSHGDHINPTTAKNLISSKIPLYFSRPVLRHLSGKHKFLIQAQRNGLANTFGEHPFLSGEFNIRAFKVRHDSAGGCVGFSICLRRGNKVKKITVSTDIASAGPELIPCFIDSDIIIIESNHDRQMLMNSSRPAILKKRITEKGHLSNDEAAEFISQVIKVSKCPPLKIGLAHISEECNNHEIAVRTMKNALKKSGCSATEIFLTYKSRPSEIICLT
ncbi:MAG: MBL fold metallo-hydrolase [Fibrobacterota bacterium]